MSVLPIDPPPRPGPPSPAQITAALDRHRAHPRPLAAVPPSVLAELPTDGLPAALVRDRARFIACAAGRHTWVEIPALAVTVCQHCPVHADQAARVRAAVAAKAAP